MNLFTLLWNSMADAQAPVSTGRGASAAADFAAHKTITLPDARGRAVFGKDDMGGTVASRVTNANSGITATTLGVAGGDERLHQHTHGVTDPTHSHGIAKLNQLNGGGAGADMNGTGSPDATTRAASTGITINNAGAGSSQNMPPALILNKIIKL